MNVFSTVAAVFLMLLVGWAARKFRIIESNQSVVVSSMVLYITGPAFVFSAIYGKALTREMVGAPLVVFGITMLVMGLAYFSARALHLDRRTTGGVMLAASFGNTGFLGYPVVTAAFAGGDGGTALATAVMIDQFAMSLPLVSVGIMVAASMSSTNVSRWQMLGFLKTPLFIATVIAILLKPVALPEFLVSSIDLLGDATVPLAMISIGLMLSRSSLKAAAKPFTLALILKMVLLPVLVYAASVFLGMKGTVQQVAVLESAMPPAVVSGVIAGRYGANGSFVAGAILIMTLLSMLTIPLVLVLVR